MGPGTREKRIYFDLLGDGSHVGLGRIGANCWAMAFMLPESRMAAMAFWIAATAPSEPAGADLAAISIMLEMDFWKSPGIGPEPSWPVPAATRR